MWVRRSEKESNPQSHLSTLGTVSINFEVPISDLNNPADWECRLYGGAKMAEYIRVAQLNDVPPGTLKQVQMSGKKIALANVGGAIYAFDDICPHRRGPLTPGKLAGDVLTCPWHGSKFNLKTGVVTSPPATTGIKTYPVKLEGNDINVEIP